MTAYRTSGFAILSATLVALALYAFVMIFFMLNSTWIAPTVMSQTSDKLLQFRARYQSALQLREAAQVAYDQALRNVAMHEERKASLQSIVAKTRRAVQSELKSDAQVIASGQAIAVDKYRDIAASDELQSDLEQSRKQINQSLAAGLITEDDANRARANIQTFDNGVATNKAALLALDQQTNQLQRKRATLLGGSSSLDAIGAVKAISDAEYQLVQADNDLKTAQATAGAAKNQLQIADNELKNISQSVYVAAIDKDLNLAFVPYDNAKAVKVGADVYDCKLQIVWCHKVATIKRSYNDEYIVDFPVFNIRLSRTVRGFMADLDVRDPEAMHSVVLFVGKPLLF